MICRDWCELHGDRRHGDDPAIVTGFGRIGSIKCLVVGHQKGRDTKERLSCHFGCAHPEGYRKALLKMKLAEKFRLPIVTFIDTPGAYPGIGAEQRGQAESIAVNLREMSRLRVPVVCIVIGEGGSGGALGIGVGDRVAMLQNSWYSVISPEGCAAILWKEANERVRRGAQPLEGGQRAHQQPRCERACAHRGAQPAQRPGGRRDPGAARRRAPQPQGDGRAHPALRGGLRARTAADRSGHPRAQALREVPGDRQRSLTAPCRRSDCALPSAPAETRKAGSLERLGAGGARTPLRAVGVDDSHGFC
jgi:hypothetical protein